MVVLLCGLGPMIANWVYKALLHPRPFWVHFFDPETIYFYEGGRILGGHSPFNVDSPGIPVYLLTSLLQLVTGHSPLDYPSFRLPAYALALLLNVLAAWLLSRTLLSRGDAILSIAALWTYFLAPQALERDVVWSAEILFFATGVLAIVAVFRLFQGVGSPIVAGLAIGLCIAMKFVFLAWVPALWVAILVSRETVFRRLALTSAGIAAGFVGGTAVAISRYPKMFGWLVQLATHSGQYGWGKAEAPRPTEVMANVARALLTSKAWLVWVAVGAGLALLSRKRPDKLPLVSFALSAFVFAYGMTMRTPDFRYLLPSGIAVLVLFVVAAREPWSNRAVPVCVVALGAVISWKGVRDDVRSHDLRMAVHADLRARIERDIASIAPPDPVVIYGWRMPQPSFSLRIMTRDTRQLAEIAGRYPREGHCDWTGNISLPPGASGWDVLVVGADLLNAYPRLGRVVAREDDYMIVVPVTSRTTPGMVN